jgi:hypothetical protein
VALLALRIGFEITESGKVHITRIISPAFNHSANAFTGADGVSEAMGNPQFDPFVV